MQYDTKSQSQIARSEYKMRFEDYLAAMPAHWFYRLKNITATFNGGIAGFVDPTHPHPESFMTKMNYRPNIENAKQLGRPYDILHHHDRFYRTNYSPFSFSIDDREASTVMQSRSWKIVITITMG
ncbi:MAG: hypothetical protein NMNS01_03250 [Nitrosomonas sp.]|nr:MAG: hypothetical protein NMNS01_03250 [Nitrosomonas sp.]